VALAFCIDKDLQGILLSPIQQPMAMILFNSFGRRGTLVIWAFVVVVQFTMGTSMLTSTSRQIFAFSRDGGLPFSRWLYYVSNRSHSPVRCVWFTVFVSLLLGLLAFAGTNAIGAVFSLVVTAQYLAYSIPISARFLGGKELKCGPFSLGKFSRPVALTAVLWMAFIIVVFLFPTTSHFTGADMNYTVVVFGGTISLSVLYFYIPVYGGVYWFKGPVPTIKDNIPKHDAVSNGVAGENAKR